MRTAHSVPGGESRQAFHVEPQGGLENICQELSCLPECEGLCRSVALGRASVAGRHRREP